MRKYLILLTSLFLLFFSRCKREIITTVQVPVAHSWSLDSFLTGPQKILSASLALNDSVLAVANRSTIWYIKANRPNIPVEGIYIPGITQLYSIVFPPSLSKTISVSI